MLHKGGNVQRAARVDLRKLAAEVITRSLDELHFVERSKKEQPDKWEDVGIWWSEDDDGTLLVDVNIHQRAFRTMVGGGCERDVRKFILDREFHFEDDYAQALKEVCERVECFVRYHQLWSKPAQIAS
jgi:hypothetical protein